MKIPNLTIILILLVMAGCAENNQTQVDTSVSEQAAVMEPQEAAESSPEAEAVSDQNQEFEAYIELFLHRYWELYPGYAVYVGFYDFDNQLAVPNGALRVLRRTFFVNQLDVLKTFSAVNLSKSNATDLAILVRTMKANLWYIDEFRAYEWDPSQYNVAGTFGLILATDYKPLAERISTISERLERVPEYYQAARQNIKLPSLPHLGLAIQQSRGALGVFDSTIPEQLANIELGEQELNEINLKLAAASAAINDYVAWLEAKQLELAEVGGRDFRLGEESYEKKFKHDIVSNYTGKQLYEVALAAKLTLHSEMIVITKDLWPTYFPDTELPIDELLAVKKMIDHLSLKHVERDKFVDEIRRQMPIIQKFMDDNQLLDSDPTRPLVVRLAPEYQRGFAGASVDAPGPYNATASTYYNVSPLDGYTDDQAESYLREYNHWILQILNMHEAIPGHYTQLMHANKSPSKIKSIFANGSMIEGWANYSERMMLESGYGDNQPEMWLMWKKWSLRSVANTILDYSIQVLGMEKDEALALMLNDAFQEQTEAEGKWRRATVSQVQLTSYFNGYTEIYAFREELKQKMGEAFDLKTFHNKFLSYGSAPVPMIRALMLEELALSSN
ncbi:MAG: hypothetical protein ACI9FR_003106 [Cryomorphaceae bacterium]